MRRVFRDDATFDTALGSVLRREYTPTASQWKAMSNRTAGR